MLSAILEKPVTKIKYACVHPQEDTPQPNSREHQSKSESWSLSDLLGGPAFLKFRGGAAGLLLYPESAGCTTCTAANLSASICTKAVLHHSPADNDRALVEPVPFIAEAT